MYSDGERGGEKHVANDTKLNIQLLQVVESLPRAVSPLSPPPRKRRLIRSVSDDSPYDEQSADDYASSSDSDDRSSEDCIPYTGPSVDAPNVSEFVLMTYAEDRERVNLFRRQRRSSSLPAPPPALRNARPQQALQRSPQQALQHSSQHVLPRSPQQAPHDALIHELQHEPQDELQQESQQSPQRDSENT